ncbi:MAG: hypothetical protein PUE41_03320, partial [bacterium]|nr:hypothetical protein [bacterium]
RMGGITMLKTRRSKQICGLVGWLLCFALVNGPVGMIGQRLEPFVLGMPFSLFYFWAAYTLLIVVGIVLAGLLFRD